MSPPSRGFELLREAALSLAEEHRGIASLVNPRQTEAVAYRSSPLSTPEAIGLPGAAPGTLLPDFPLQVPEGHLTQHLGPSFTLLAFSPDVASDDLARAAVTTAASAVARRTPVDLDLLLLCPTHSFTSPAATTGTRRAADEPSWRLAAVDAGLLREHAPHGHALYLLRPDRHVAARRHLQEQESPADLEAWLDAALRRACGAGPSSLPPDQLTEKASLEATRTGQAAVENGQVEDAGIGNGGIESGMKKDSMENGSMERKKGSMEKHG